MKKNTIYSLMKCSLVVVIISLIQACSLNVPIDNPEVSKFSYVPKNDSKSVQLNLTDNFDENHQISHGRVKINLVHDAAELKAGPFLTSSLKNELESRGLPIQYNASGENTIEFQDFEILNHRVSGFSPMVTISTIKAVLVTKDGDINIAAMVKRAKVPVWSMNEINEPCYNEPIELLVKEVAAKINKNIFGYSLSDKQVDDLVSKIESEANSNSLSYLDVYELGFSNNPKAIEPLKELASHKGEYIRMAAISSMGILGVEDYLDDLKTIYANARTWQDRGMALKSIGDIGGDEAIEFLTQEKAKWINLTGSEAKWNSLIISLYI